MTDYKDKHGLNVPIVSSDPSDPIIGQVWYNTTTNLLKYKGPLGAGSWASGGNLNTGRTAGGMFGLQSASIYFGGNIAPGPGTVAIVESYNGSAWSEVGDLNEVKDYIAGAGTSSAGLAFGGEPTTANVESWNGSAWSETTNMNTAKDFHCGAGTQSSALAFAGEDSGGLSAKTESWNGSAWSEVGDQNTARKTASSAGASNTDALLFMGDDVGNGQARQITESWNGTSWSEVADTNTGGRLGSGCGTSTEALAMGRYSPSPSNWDLTEEWNGSSWTEVADMATGRYYTAGSGTQALGLVASGQAGPGGPNQTATEEFTKSNGVETISTT
tara:strand:+ start:56 stop:1045 length:990 start_codon:yes stop_codon:yes gene_type:complete